MSKGCKRCDGCKGCENCAHLIPIGEGDHICYEGSGMCFPICVISEYEPTDQYYECNGEMWEEK